MKPNKKVLRRWVKALRSGEYKQGRQRLCSVKNGEVHWCCLGVLADIAIDSYWVEQWGKTDIIGWRLVYPEAQAIGGIGALPEDFLQSLGFDPEDQRYFFYLNDMACCSFEQIAGAIEKMYLTTA